MARDIDGGSLDFGSDASIDAFTTKSIFAHINNNVAAGATTKLLGKVTAANNWALEATRAAALETNLHLQLTQDFTITDGVWVTSNNTVTQNTDTAIGCVYNNSAAGNTPTFYVNGASSATTTSIPATGSAGSDAAQSMTTVGAGSAHILGWLIYDDVAFTAAQANMHRWWGYVGTWVSVWHPFVTEATANKGTATADASEASTSVVAMNKVPRPGCAGVW